MASEETTPYQLLDARIREAFDRHDADAPEAVREAHAALLNDLSAERIADLAARVHAAREQYGLYDPARVDELLTQGIGPRHMPRVRALLVGRQLTPALATLHALAAEAGVEVPEFEPFLGSPGSAAPVTDERVVLAMEVVASRREMYRRPAWWVESSDIERLGDRVLTYAELRTRTFPFDNLTMYFSLPIPLSDAPGIRADAVPVGPVLGADLKAVSRAWAQAHGRGTEAEAQRIRDTMAVQAFQAVSPPGRRLSLYLYLTLATPAGVHQHVTVKVPWSSPLYLPLASLAAEVRGGEAEPWKTTDPAGLGADRSNEAPETVGGTIVLETPPPSRHSTSARSIGERAEQGEYWRRNYPHVSVLGPKGEGDVPEPGPDDPAPVNRRICLKRTIAEQHLKKGVERSTETVRKTRRRDSRSEALANIEDGYFYWDGDTPVPLSDAEGNAEINRQYLAAGKRPHPHMPYSAAGAPERPSLGEPAGQRPAGPPPEPVDRPDPAARTAARR